MLTIIKKILYKVIERIGTIHAPKKPEKIPSHSQWLLGQGAGAWFCIDATEKEGIYAMKRFTPSGNLDCNRIFEVEENGSVFDIKSSYEFVHLSHCAKCTIKQNEIVFIFNYKGE